MFSRIGCGYPSTDRWGSGVGIGRTDGRARRRGTRTDPPRGPHGLGALSILNPQPSIHAATRHANGDVHNRATKNHLKTVTHEYACTGCGHVWEAEQSISAAPLTECPNCKQATAKRQVSGGAGFILKGGGWYADLYSSGGSKKGSESSTESSASSEGKSESKKPDAAATSTTTTSSTPGSSSSGSSTGAASS